MNLFEITRQAYGGTGLAGLSRQFGLGPDETQRAVDSLLPAFSLALQRSLADPSALTDLLSTLGSGAYASAFDAPRGGATAADGTLVERLFGSPETSRRIAAEAAAMSGVGLRVIQDMMPMLAATLMGGLSRYVTLEGFADLLRQWSDALKAASPKPPPPPPPADPWSAWTGVMGAMLPINTERPGPSPAAVRPGSQNPLEAWSGLLGTMVGAGVPPAPQPPPPAVPDALGALRRMFEVGREVQDQHLAAFTAILDGMWSAGRPR